MNRNTENDYSKMTDVLRFALREFVKLELNTGLPGIIRSYDPITKRARVAPAVLRLMTDGRTFELPEVVNVPVMHPSGGGYTLLFPLQPGDAVWLAFSQRGLSRFKQGYTVSAPDEGMFSIKDAVAMAGFGSLSVTPASTTGVSLQSDDGSHSIVIDDTGINITTSGEVTITPAGGATVNGSLHVTEDITAGRDFGWTRNITNSTGTITFDQPVVLTSSSSLVHDSVPIDNTHVHEVTVVTLNTPTDTGVPK